MKVTNELLKQYHSCKEGLEWFNKTYPDGVELIELIQNSNLTDEQLFWGYKFIQPSVEELAAYNARLHITNSERIERSKSVISSHDVFDSTIVEDSSFVSDSLAVLNSNNIFGSEDIANSANILNSENVEESQKIITSKGIHYSDQIINSENISYCSDLLNCTNCNNTIYSYNCYEMDNSAFCGYCRDCRNCLFCIGLNGQSYQIFNQPVSIDEWERINEILSFMIQNETSTFIKINPFLVLTPARFKFNLRLDSLFDGLSQDLFGWIGTLPNYNEKIFLDLFFRS